jgi:hypothetical protein
VGAGRPEDRRTRGAGRHARRRTPQLTTSRPGLILITGKGFASRVTEADLAARGTILLRPARKDEIARHGAPLLKSVRQLIESVNNTLKGQLDLEAHGGPTFEEVAIRVAQRILAMAAALCHNNKPDSRSPGPLSPMTVNSDWPRQDGLIWPRGWRSGLSWWGSGAQFCDEVPGNASFQMRILASGCGDGV